MGIQEPGRNKNSANTLEKGISYFNSYILDAKSNIFSKLESPVESEVKLSTNNKMNKEMRQLEANELKSEVLAPKKVPSFLIFEKLES